MHKLCDMTKQYLAGFFDGEGTVSINNEKIRLTIPQTNEKVLLEVLNLIGGGSVKPLKKRKEHWKDAWVYNSNSNKISLIALKLIYPYLIVKKDIAKKAISILTRKTYYQNLHLKTLNIALKLVLEGKSYRQAEDLTGIGRESIRRAFLKIS